MNSVVYEVSARFKDEATGEAWVKWLLHEHIADVVNAGAACGRVVKLDDPPLSYVAQYEFATPAAFEAYLAQHAPRLREEGLKRFSAGQVEYSRRTGLIVGP